MPQAKAAHGGSPDAHESAHPSTVSAGIWPLKAAIASGSGPTAASFSIAAPRRKTPSTQTHARFSASAGPCHRCFRGAHPHTFMLSSTNSSAASPVTSPMRRRKFAPGCSPWLTSIALEARPARCSCFAKVPASQRPIKPIRLSMKCRRSFRNNSGVCGRSLDRIYTKCENCSCSGDLLWSTESVPAPRLPGARLRPANLRASLQTNPARKSHRSPICAPVSATGRSRRRGRRYRPWTGACARQQKRRLRWRTCRRRSVQRGPRSVNSFKRKG